MYLVRHLVQTLLMFLFVAFGVGATFAAQGDWTRVSYPMVAQDLSAQPISLTNTARAPPTTISNVMATGIAFAQTGNLRTLDGAESPGAVYALLQSSIATNRAVSVDPSRATRGTPEYELLNNPPANTRVELSVNRHAKLTHLGGL